MCVCAFETKARRGELAEHGQLDIILDIILDGGVVESVKLLVLTIQWVRAIPSPPAGVR